MANERRPPIEVVWETPADGPRRSRKYDDAIAEVADRAGTWARIRAFASQSSAYGARKSLAAQLQTDERWEVRTARLPEGGYGLYLRYRTPEQLRTKRK